MAGQVEPPVATPKESIGGSAETEAREVAVKPTGPRSPRAVITATPAACFRKTERSRPGEPGRAVPRSEGAVMNRPSAGGTRGGAGGRGRSPGPSPRRRGASGGRRTAGYPPGAKEFRHGVRLTIGATHSQV